MTGNKVCPTCGELKPLGDFGHMRRDFPAMESESCTECLYYGSGDDGYKVCADCGNAYPLFIFGVRSPTNPKPRSYCPECMRVRQRKYRKANPHKYYETYWSNPEKVIARKRLHRDIRNGKFPAPTEFFCAVMGCFDRATEYHHWSYEEVCEVSPLCSGCHANISTIDPKHIVDRLLFDIRDRRLSATKLREWKTG